MKISVVIVTYNRFVDLMKTLECYDNQTYLMDSLIVVDNACTDGSSIFLDEWKKMPGQYEKKVIHNDTNVGGSGGFYLGIQEAIKHTCDYIFLADDDAFAENNMLEIIHNFYDVHKNEEIAGMCTSVVNHGVFDLLHRRRISRGLFTIKEYHVDSHEYEKGFFEVDEFSFVGALISKNTVKKIGLPKQEYFIYFDDTEYSLRLRKEGKIYCIPSAKMNHNSIISTNTTWKDYYNLRNRLDILKLHFPLRYYAAYVVIQYIKKCSFAGIIFKHRTKGQRKMFRKAIVDSITNNIKKDDVYYPGIDIESV